MSKPSPKPSPRSWAGRRCSTTKWYAAEFARANLDIYLQKLYHERSELLVFFLCKAYSDKEWCGLEWRAGRDLLKQNKDDQLMFLRLDDANVPGLYGIDGYLDISKMPDSNVSRTACCFGIFSRSG